MKVRICARGLDQSTASPFGVPDTVKRLRLDVCPIPTPDASATPDPVDVQLRPTVPLAGERQQAPV